MSTTTNPNETKETIETNITNDEEHNQNNYLEEYELINDSFPDEDPQ